MGAFVEVGRIRVTNTREVAISRRGDGMYSLAQSTEVPNEEGNPMRIFFKGAFSMDGAGLLKIRDLIDEIFDENGKEKNK